MPIDSGDGTFDYTTDVQAAADVDPSFSDPIDMYVDWGGWGTNADNSGVDLSGGTGVADWTRNSTGGVAAGASGSSWFDWDGIKKWATEGTGKDKKGPSILSMAMPTLLSAGMSAAGELFTGAQAKKRELEKRKVDIEQQNANSRTAQVAQTSYGSSVPTIKKKTGLINQFHPVTVQRPTGVA